MTLNLKLRPIDFPWALEAIDAVNDLYVWREAISFKLKSLETEIKRLKEDITRIKSSQF